MDLSAGTLSASDANKLHRRLDKLEFDFNANKKELKKVQREYAQVLEDNEIFQETIREQQQKLQELQRCADILTRENEEMAQKLRLRGSPVKNSNSKRAKTSPQPAPPAMTSTQLSEVILHIPETSNPFNVLNNVGADGIPLCPQKSLFSEKNKNKGNSPSSSSETPFTLTTQENAPAPSTSGLQAPFNGTPPTSSEGQDGCSAMDDDGFQTVTKRYNKYPPIFISEVEDWPLLREQLNSVIKERYESKAVGRDVKLNIQNDSDYRAVQDFLKTNNIPHVQINMTNIDSFKVIIKNVHESISLDYIKEDLATQGIHPIRISRLTKSRSTNAPALVFVHLSSNDANKKIYDLPGICGTTIKVELFRKFNNVMQCYRCQGFNHGSLSCNLPVKCMKCAGPHSAADCTLPRNQPDTVFKCSNCGGNHTSNYRKCPSFPAHHPSYYAKIKNQKDATTSSSTAPSSSQPSGPKKTFFSPVQVNHQPTSHPFNSSSPKSYSAVAAGGSAPSTKQNNLVDKFGEFFALMTQQMNAQMQAQMASQAKMLESFRNLLHHG